MRFASFFMQNFKNSVIVFYPQTSFKKPMRVRIIEEDICFFDYRRRFNLKIHKKVAKKLGGVLAKQKICGIIEGHGERMFVFQCYKQCLRRKSLNIKKGEKLKL